MESLQSYIKTVNPIFEGVSKWAYLGYAISSLPKEIRGKSGRDEYLRGNFGIDDETFITNVQWFISDKVIYDYTSKKTFKVHINDDVTMKMISIPQIYGSRVASGTFKSIKIECGDGHIFYITNNNRTNAGMAFENDMLDNMKDTFIWIYNSSDNGIERLKNIDTCVPQTDKISEKIAIDTLKYLKNHSKTKDVIKDIFMTDGLTKDDIEGYVKRTGNGNIRRNSQGQIIYKDTAKINMESLKKVLMESGMIISDITISKYELSKKPEDLTEDNNKDYIFLSLKHKEAQLSGISITKPFEGEFAEFVSSKEYPKYTFDTMNGVSLSDIKGYSDERFEVLYNMFDIMGIKQTDRAKVFKYYGLPLSEREYHKMEFERSTITPEDEQIYKSLILRLIGGNYHYVNANGVIRYIGYDLKEDDLPFDIVNEGCSISILPKMICTEFYIYDKEHKNNKMLCKLKFRTSEEYKQYPYRLFVEFQDEYFLDKLFGKPLE